MLSQHVLRALLIQALDRVHLDPDAGRETVRIVAQAAEQTSSDGLYALTCYLMGRAALAIDAYQLAEAPLLDAVSNARSTGDLSLAARAAAALDCARSPQRFTDHDAQRAAEHAFARRLAAGGDVLALMAERVRLDVYRAASVCPARALIRQARLGQGVAAVMSIGWCVQADAQLADVLGDQPTQWAQRLTPILLRPVHIVGVICDAGGPLWPDMRAPSVKEHV